MRGDVYHLHKWSVSEYSDPYSDISRPCLVGYRDEETKSVITSRIVKAEGLVVTTSSGSIYILEDIDPGYLKWMEENNITYDPVNPIKFKKP